MDDFAVDDLLRLATCFFFAPAFADFADAFFLAVEVESAGGVPGAIAMASAAPAMAITRICTVRINSLVGS